MTHTGHQFQGTCHHCKRGQVWIDLRSEPYRFVYSAHSYVVGFGTPAQKLIKCEQSGQIAPGYGL